MQQCPKCSDRGLEVPAEARLRYHGRGGSRPPRRDWQAVQRNCEPSTNHKQIKQTAMRSSFPIPRVSVVARADQAVQL